MNPELSEQEFEECMDKLIKAMATALAMAKKLEINTAMALANKEENEEEEKLTSPPHGFIGVCGIAEDAPLVTIAWAAALEAADDDEEDEDEEE